tara:strand:- start:2343 stop:3626 length:1284 start_codon:yes stop_codon:yes gene_type:complete
MATTTRATLRQRLSEEIGDYQSLTTTSAGNSAGTSVVDTGLRNLPGGDRDSAFDSWYILVTSGANTGESRRIKDYIANTTTLVVQESFSGGAVDSLVTYELHRYDPSQKHQAINRAIEELYPFLYLPIRDETIVVDDRLTNSDFETFSGGFTNWTEVGSPTVTADTTYVMHGSQSAKVVGDSSAVGQLTQAPTININELSNKSVTFKCWVWCAAADTARIRLDWDGSDIENSDYHKGQNEWELLDITASVPTSATQVKAIIEVAASGTAYFDAAWLLAGPIQRYTIPTSIVTGPHYLTEQGEEAKPNGEYYPIRGGPTPGRRLRFEGMNVLSRPASDIATTEVGTPQVNIITAYAAMYFFRTQAAGNAIDEREGYSDLATIFSRDAVRMASQPGMRMPRLGAHKNNHVWHIEHDSSGRYIVFDRGRI